MTVLILIILSLLSLLACSFYKEHVFLTELQSRETVYNRTLLINSGKRIHAFTIERSQYIDGNVVYSVGNAYIFIIKALSMVFKFNKLDSRLSHLAIKEAVVKMKEHAADADYIIDVKYEVCFLEVGKVAAHAYGTAIYLYKDTLGLFDYPEGLSFTMFPKCTSLFFRRMVKLLTCGVSIITLFFYLYFQLVNIVLYNFSPNDEKVTWSFIKDSVLKSHVQSPDLLKIEDQIQDALVHIPRPGDKNNSLKIFLLKNKENSAINIYPGGNITITTAALKKVHSENQLMFLLSHEIAHYFYGDFLKKQGVSIINIYFATQLFAEESILGNIFINPSDFDEISYNENDEIRADRFATDILEKIYGHVGGVAEGIKYFEALSLSNNNYHKVSQNRKNAISDYIRAKKFKIDKVHPLDMIINDSVVNNSFASSAMPYANAVNKELLEQFEIKFTEHLNEYDALLATYLDILNIKSNINSTELELKLSTLDDLNLQIAKHSMELKNILKTYDQKMQQSVLSDDEKTKNSIFIIEWEKIRDSKNKLIDDKFYKNKNLILAQNRLLSFLVRRIGTYKVSEGVIEFDSVNAKDQYRSLVDKIEQYR